MSRFAFTYEDPSYSDDYDPDAEWQDVAEDDEPEDEPYSPYYGA